MKNPLVILVVIIAVVAIGYAGMLLFSEPENRDVALEPIERDSASSPAASPVVVPDTPSTHRPAEPEREDVVIEDVRPRSKWKWSAVDVKVTVVDVKTRRTVPGETITFGLFQNELPIPARPAPGSRPGQFAFTGLVPGRYRFEADAGKGRSGALTLNVDPGLKYDRKLYVSEPAPLQIRVVRAKSGNPIVGASISASDLVSRGATDSKGIFRSKRGFTPDPALAVIVSKPGYFTTLVHPYSEKLMAARKSALVTVILKPLGGSARISGTVVTTDGEPLKRWALRLTPVSSREAGAGMLRFYETTTNHKGEFAFRELAGGTYSLEGLLRSWTSRDAPDFPPLFSRSLVVAQGEALEDQKIVCELSPLKLSGVVLDADTLEPVAGVSVLCNGHHEGMAGGGPGDPYHFEPVRSDGNGLFSIGRTFMPNEINILLQRTGIRLVPEGGEFEIFRLPHASRSMTQVIGDLTRNVPIRIWIRGESSIELRGRVTDSDGLPLKGVIAEANPLADLDRKRFRAVTNAKGDFIITRLFGGRWHVKVDLPNGPSLERALTLSASVRPEKELFVAPGSCRIEGEVDLEKAAYFPRVTIRGDGIAIENKRLPTSGRFVFEHLPAGTVTVTVESYSTQRFEERSLVIRETTIDLVRGGTVRVAL